MQNAPPRLPSRGAASIQRSSSGAVDEPAERGRRSRRTRRGRSPTPSSHDTSGGADRQRRDEVPPRQARRRGRAARLGPQPAAEVGEGVVDGGLHGVERRPADGVGEQRRVERARPTAAAGRRRTASPLIAFIAAAHGTATSRPRRHLGVVGGRGARPGRRAWRGRARPASAAARCDRRGTRRGAASCDVTSRRAAGPTPPSRSVASSA